MSGDADLIYPIEVVKSLGIPVHAIFFPTRFSLEMAYHVDSATVLNYKNKFQFKARKTPKRLKVVKITEVFQQIKSPAYKMRGR